MTVIYVDVLFIINFFITFLLVLMTGRLLKQNDRLIRFTVASAIGGAYSLVILIDDLSVLVSVIGKLIAAFLIVLVAFGMKNIKRYLKSVLVFFFSNLVLLGIMVGIWFIFKPPGVVINNTTVYFDVSAKVLLISALIAYVFSVLVIRIYNKTTAKKEIFDLTIEKNGRTTHLFAFADSGNNLSEPFTSYPVIIAKKSLFENEKEERVIPFETVGGEGILGAFKPDRVTIKTSGESIDVENVYIALSDHLNNDDYSAVLNPKIIN